MSKQVLAIANYRVSSDEQLLNGSLGRQETSVINAAEVLGVKIVRYWSGSVSSKKWENIDRDDLEEMLTECKRNPNIKYAIFDELDRFMRSMLEVGYFIVQFKKLGVQVKFASQPNLKSDTAADTLLLMLEAFKAEGSNEERQKKSIDGQTTALQQGRYPFAPKPGYMGGSKPGIPEIHPIKGPALKKVLLDICYKRVTPTQGLIDLNNSDFMSSGHSHYKMDKFRKIATDEFNAGVVSVNKQVKVRNENGLHEPLLTLAEHQELLRIFEAKRKTQSGPRKNGNPKYPLNNIASHDTCLEMKNKGRFVGYDHGNGKNPDLVYEKYRCRSCGFYLHRHELHPQITKQFADHPISKEGTEDLLKALDVVWKRREAQAKQDAVRMSQKLKTLNEDISSRAIAAIDLSNKSIKPQILANIEDLKRKVSSLEEELAALNQKADTDKERFLRFAFSFVENMGSKFLDISFDNRLRCKQIVFPAGFYMDAKKKVYTPEISPLYRLAVTKKDAEASDLVQMVRVKRL